MFKMKQPETKAITSASVGNAYWANVFKVNERHEETRTYKPTNKELIKVNEKLQYALKRKEQTTNEINNEINALTEKISKLNEQKASEERNGNYNKYTALSSDIAAAEMELKHLRSRLEKVDELCGLSAEEYGRMIHTIVRESAGALKDNKKKCAEIIEELRALEEKSDDEVATANKMLMTLQHDLKCDSYQSVIDSYQGPFTNVPSDRNKIRINDNVITDLYESVRKSYPYKKILKATEK